MLYFWGKGVPKQLAVLKFKAHYNR